MKKSALLAGIASAALVVSTPLVAQTQTTTGDQQVFIQKLAANEQLASSVVGVNVQNNAGEKLGSVNDLVIGENGNVSAAVIGVGGLLGIGEKNIAVSYDSLQKSRDGDPLVIVINATKEELNAAPDYLDADDKPLSVTKRLTEGAKETYEKAKETVQGESKTETRTQ